MKILKIENTKGQAVIWVVPESNKECMAVARMLGPLSFSEAKEKIREDFESMAEFSRWVTNADDIVAISLAIHAMYAVHTIRQSLNFRSKASITFGMLRMVPTCLRIRRGVRQGILRNRNMLIA